MSGLPNILDLIEEASDTAGHGLVLTADVIDGKLRVLCSNMLQRWEYIGPDEEIDLRVWLDRQLELQIAAVQKLRKHVISFPTAAVANQITSERNPRPPKPFESPTTKEQSVKVQTPSIVFAGTTFESEADARWAIFLSDLGVGWQYRRSGCVLKDGRKCIPTFWLPSLQVWLDIAANKTELESEFDVCTQLFHQSSFPVVSTFGLPDEELLHVFCNDTVDGGGGFNHWHACEFSDENGKLCIATFDQRGCRTFVTNNWEPIKSICLGESIVTTRLMRAFESARKARFSGPIRGRIVPFLY